MSHTLVLQKEPPTKLSRSIWYTQLWFGLTLTMCFQCILEVKKMHLQMLHFLNVF